ncbi:MAG TPA: hypothetical protein VEX15_23710 [Nocardioidaceae bacterium]|nr:hypothetical protein [Nocardioidaceae bacterium]
MAKRLFLHIGAMKSGTSYLQALCADNQDRLEAAGVRFVGGIFEAGVVASEILRTGRRPSTIDNMCRRLQQATEGWDGDVFLSMELLSRRPPQAQQRLVQAAAAEEVHVIVSGRDLARVIPSRWLTTMRNRRTWTWPEYLRLVCVDDPNETVAWKNFWDFQDLSGMLRSWTAVADPHRMHMVTAPRSSSDPMILWRRFAGVLGIDPSGYRKPKPARANPARGVAAAEVLRRVNIRLDDLSYVVYRRGIGNPVDQIYEGAPAGEPRLQIPEAYRGWVEKRARRMNDEIAELGVNVVGDLTELLPGPPDPDAMESVEVSDAQLLETALDGLAGMGRIMAVNRLENESLRHRHGLPPAGHDDVRQGRPRRYGNRARSLTRRLRAVLRR